MKLTDNRVIGVLLIVFLMSFTGYHIEVFRDWVLDTVPPRYFGSPIRAVLAGKPDSITWISKSGSIFKVYPEVPCVQHQTYFQCGPDRYPPN